MRIRLMAAAALATVSVLATAGAAAADDGDTVGVAKDSPGVVSGNTIQVPVEVGANVCGNSIDVVGLLNPAFGNKCKED
ncbi:chaplin [Streptomyces sp. NPDC059785]|uniref:chaplin n=1 Tax=unclassified Streptomyces TaxID=2593676 RepID=UPI003660F2EE